MDCESAEVCPLCYSLKQAELPRAAQPCAKCLRNLPKVGFVVFVVDDVSLASVPYGRVRAICGFPSGLAKHYTQLPELFLEDRGFSFVRWSDAVRLGILESWVVPEKERSRTVRFYCHRRHLMG